MAPLAAWQSGTLAAADVGKALDEGPFDKVGNITKDFLLQGILIIQNWGTIILIVFDFQGF